MIALRSAGRALGVGLAAAVFVGGCVSAKSVPSSEETAAAPAEEEPAAEEAMLENDWYTVVSGDCLWCISAKPDIYGDPYKWPLIYRKNVAQIGDADLIFPGQEFEIDRNLTPELLANATDHARNRGEWTLGEPEPADIQFIADNP